HRALQDHRHVAPPEAAQLLGALAEQVLALEQDAAARDPRRRTEDLHHRVRDRRLAAAGLAGEADDLALENREVDAVHGPRTLFADVVLDHELLQLEQARRAGVRRGRLLDEARHDEASGRATKRPPTNMPSSRRRPARSARRRGLLTSSMPASTSTRPSTV